MAISVFLLSGCHTIVPTPSMPLTSHDVSLPHYQLHNIGPQRVVESRAIHWVDLNQDGFLDLLVGGRKSVDSFHVEWGDGAGHWETEDGPMSSMQPRDFAVGDVNGNGQLDILIGGEGDQKGLQVWEMNQKKHTWALLSSPVLAGVFDDVSLKDLNHDGWLDIVAAKSDSEQDGGIYVLLNDAKGGWFDAVGPMVSGYFTGVTVADINHDGDMDIIASRRGGLGSMADSQQTWNQSGGVQIWYGDGAARWEPKALPVNADAESVTVADVNGDGQLDIVAGLYQQGIVLWLADNGQWQRQSIVSDGTWGDIRVGDLDANGSRELFASSRDGRGLGAWHWSFGSFSKKNNLLPNYGVYYGLDLGDVRNDGTLAVAAIRSDGGAEVWSMEKASPLPVKTFQGKKIASKHIIFFDSGQATLNATALKGLQTWLQDLGTSRSGLHVELEGRADIRPIHSDIYPNNRALSQARAESVVGWLHKQGVPLEAASIHVLGAKHPLKHGDSPDALKLNRSVSIQAYQLRQVRLPPSQHGEHHNDLFHVRENKVFRTIHGVPEYRIGNGDQLSITFWQGAKSKVYKVTVQVDGTVSLPYQAALKVAGLTPREVDANVTEILKRFERKPRVDVMVLKARSKLVSIFGEVQNLTRQPTGPGTYFLRGKETLVNFLSRAGGPGKDADLSKVQILRDGKTVILNLNKAIKQGDWKENAVLDDGDTIFVPSLAQSKRRV
ncbi:MAG: FG-GAP-like repeat-containing protein, partial [Mariprofundaceae bacterium]|nr:FG-GAP-like repeat-containing protein [Mariprofundaceae bacterium]